MPLSKVSRCMNKPIRPFTTLPAYPEQLGRYALLVVYPPARWRKPSSNILPQDAADVVGWCLADARTSTCVPSFFLPGSVYHETWYVKLMRGGLGFEITAHVEHKARTQTSLARTRRIVLRSSMLIAWVVAINHKPTSSNIPATLIFRCCLTNNSWNAVILESIEYSECATRQRIVAVFFTPGFSGNNNLFGLFARQLCS